MKTYKLFNEKTGKTIRIVEANNPLEIMKKYGLFTKEHIYTKMEEITT